MNEDYYKKYEPIFGSWHIKEKIGEGAFGSVYAIEREDMGIVYRSALKTMTIPQTEDEVKSSLSDGMTREEVTAYYQELVHNIVSEFVLMSRLKGNSHIVSYEDHEVFEHEDDIGWDILIRMELLTPLVSLTSEGTLAEKEVIKLGVDICKALEFCRKYKIIHRDIKPENIFIAPSGDYKIGDFGIAKTVEKTQVGLSRKGTYVYMAPEAYRGEAYGASVDIYSLGIVMYKLLNNNRTPFLPNYPNPISYNDREDALGRRLQGDDMPEPRRGGQELCRIVMKACSYDPKNRYKHARNMREELEELLRVKKFRQTAKTDDSFQIENFCKTANEEPDKTQVAKRSSVRKRFFRTRKQKRLAMAAVAVVCAMGICVAAAPKEVTAIEGVESEEIMYIGESLAPNYEVKPWYMSEAQLEFNVKDENIAHITRNGKIDGRKVGTTTVTISSGRYKKAFKLNVVPKITAIENIKGEMSLTVGDEEKLKPELSPKKFDNEKIEFKSSNKDVAQITDEGTLTAKSAGTAIITISAGGFDFTVNVTVENPIVYNPGSTDSSKKASSSKNSKTTTKSSTSGSSDKADYFDPADDEYF